LHLGTLQEISGTIERTRDQLSEIQQQVNTLEGTQPVFVKICVFTSRVPLPPIEVEDVSPDAGADGSMRDTPPKPSEDASDAAHQADAQETEAAASRSPDAACSGGSSEAQENGAVKGEGSGDEREDEKEGTESQAEAKSEIEYEIIETAYVQFTVDRYTETMAREVEALNAQVEDLTEKRDAVLEAFKEMVTHFGERPQAVKESEWWTDFLRFLKPFNKIQTAIVKQRAAEEEAAERKRKKELSGGVTHRQRG
jgi:hypothetical protein